MYNSNKPNNDELPSTAKLVKSTVLAAVTAGALLVTVVMPAEYGIDPTGVGNAIGLKKMGEIKVSLANEAAADEVKSVQEEVIASEVEPAAKPVELEEKVDSSIATRSDEMSVTLIPNQGVEIKADMMKGAIVSYEWWSEGGKANFDVHGDSKELKISYHNYSKGSATQKSGELEAAFDGSHGWFWRNRTSDDITITLKTNGAYSDIKRVQ